jgi:hypothetical protein
MFNDISLYDIYSMPGETQPCRRCFVFSTCNQVVQQSLNVGTQSAKFAAMRRRQLLKNPGATALLAGELPAQKLYLRWQRAALYQPH